MTLAVQSPAVRRNTQTFNRNRYAATALLPDYNELKDRARQIKESAIANLPELLRHWKPACAPTRPLLPGDDGRRRQPVHLRRAAAARSQAGSEGQEHHSEETKLNHALEQRA